VAVSRERVAVADGRRALVLAVADLDDIMTTGTLPERSRWRAPEAASTVTSLAWTPRRRLAVAAYGGVVCHGMGRGQPADEFAIVGSALCVDVASTGRWLAAGFQDAAVRTWRVRDAQILSMQGYATKVTQAVFDSTGRWLATNGDRDIVLWDHAGAGPGGTRPVLLTGHAATPSQLRWHPARPLLLSGGRGGFVALWRMPTTPTGPPVRPVDGWQLGAPVASLAWAVDGGTAYVGIADGGIVRLNVPAVR
jgi:WD40 repeat protein